MLKKNLKCFFASMAMFSFSAFADVNGDLHNFFDNLGYQSNTTVPQSFQGQAAGYYTGGSLFLRNQVKNFQLVSLDLPSFSGGCSGIDSFLGSFSILNADQLNAMVKNIMSTGGAYAMDLALSEAVPQIKSVKDHLQSYINSINQANINSCNTAEDLVGGIWPKTQAAQQQICRDVSTHSGMFSDWAAARQGCGTGGQFNQAIGTGGDRKNEVIVNKNLVWDALQSNGLTKSDQQLSEMLMSLSGSIIIKSNKDSATKTTLMSMAHSQDIIKAMLYGGQAKIYACDDSTKCLNPTIKTINVAPQNGLVNLVVQMINNLNESVVTDGGVLSPQVRGFLEMTPVPVLKYITNSLSLGKSINPAQYSNVIAMSLLNQYFQENIDVVSRALAQEDTPMQPQMAQQIIEAQKFIAAQISDSYKQLTNVNVMVNQMRMNEQQLTSRIVSEASVGQ